MNRGDFEERIKEVIKELEASRRLLLIDEIDTVIGAGATSGGSMDASARPTYADPLYQHVIVTTERKFWRSVESGEPPRLFGVEPPKPRIEAVRPFARRRRATPLSLVRRRPKAVALH